MANYNLADEKDRNFYDRYNHIWKPGLKLLHATCLQLELCCVIHRFEKELSSLGDCGELHENEASQINFSRENSDIVYIF